jgi:hypothetical protein
MARRPASKPSAPTARPASGPHFRAGERVRVTAYLSKGLEGVVVGPGNPFGVEPATEPTWRVELPFPLLVREIRQAFLEKAS